MLIEKSAASSFQMTPAGNHLAVCTRFIDLGTQLVEYKGTTKTMRKVLITWELPEELMSEGEYAGKPFTIGKKYTWSFFDKANLRKDLESWRGRAFTDDDFASPTQFDVKNILGKGCMLNVSHDTDGGKTYANIKAIAQLPKGMPSATPVNPLVYFSLAPDRFDNSVLDGLSDKLKETIKGSPEYREIIDGPTQKQTSPDDHALDLDSDVPF